MEKVKKVLNKGYIVIATIAVISVLLLVNFFHITSGNVIKNIFFILLDVGIMFLANKFIINKLKSKTIKICIIVLLILFLLFEILTVVYFRVGYNWDFKWIMDSSRDIATTGTTENTFYFKMFPNNWGALMMTTAAMTITG